MKGNIEVFPLGTHDLWDRLIPQKLCRRELETDELLAAIARVAAQGTAELVLVSAIPGSANPRS